MKIWNNLHICSINCKGLQKAEKRKRLIEWSKQQKCDIILMQETHFVNNMSTQLKNEFEGQIILSNGTSNSRGVAIWIKKTIKFEIN